MNVDISRKEYKLLLNLIGMAEDMFAILDYDESKTRKYDELFQKLYSRAAEFGSSDLVERDPEGGGYCSTEKVAEYLDLMVDYDTEIFWRELTDRLSDRDLSRKYGEAEYEAMHGEAIDNEMGDLCDQYAREFENHGVERIEVVARSAGDEPAPAPHARPG